jgi:Fungal specific transcription factor domain
LIASFQDPEVLFTTTKIVAYHKALSPKQKSVGTQSANPDTMFAEMLAALPDDSTIDILTTRYVSNLENALRAVHIPKFMKSCGEIKMIRQNPNLRLPTYSTGAAIPQLMAVMAIASRLSDSNELGLQQLPEALISQYLEMIKRWLERLKGKHRITLEVIRTETLLLIAKLWKDSGSLIRVAMVMGLHRDPEDLVGMSHFEKEQRRKIWQTIVELDLQLSLVIGLPPAIQSSDFNSATLINIDDYDLAEDMKEYPVPQSPSVWTDALPQIILARSIRQRLDVANILARHINIESDAAELVKIAQSLEKEHQALQSMLPPRTKPQHTLFSNLLVDVFIRRFCLTLYRTVALSEQGRRYPDARKGALRGSVGILSHLDALDPAIADLDTIKSKNYLNLFHILCKNDINQAALLLCYEIRSFNSPDRDQSSIYDHSTPWTKHSLTRIVENTLNSHLQRLGEFGTDLKVILPLSIVLQSVRSDGTPHGKRELMIRGAERVLDACRKALPHLEISSFNENADQPKSQTPNSQLVRNKPTSQLRNSAAL